MSSIDWTVRICYPSRRRSALDVLDGLGCARAGQTYQEVTLQHDWDLPEVFANGPEYFKLILQEGIGQLPGVGDTVGDLIGALDAGTELLDPVNALRGDTDLEQSVGPPLPMIDEEVAVFTLYPVVRVEQHEFSTAGGEDRLAAKGVLMVWVHIPNSDELPSKIVRREGADFVACALDPFQGGRSGIVDGTVPSESAPAEDDCYELADDVERPTHGADVILAVTHLQAGFPEVKARQVDEVLSFLGDNWDGATPLSLVGDFNLNPASDDYAKLVSGLNDLASVAFSTVALDSTNKQGWLEAESRPCELSEIGPGLACEGASHIDHVFTANFAGSLTGTRDYQPTADVDPNTGWRREMIEDHQNSTHSDHAQLAFESTLSLPLYDELPPLDVARTVTVEVHSLRAGGGDGVCDEPDPQISAMLNSSNQQDSFFAGPTDDLEWLTVNKTLQVAVAPGERYVWLELDASEYDDFACGGDDELDITPFADSSNALVVIDLDPDRGDVRWAQARNAEGLGWVNGGPVTVSNAASSSSANLVNFSVVAVASS